MMKDHYLDGDSPHRDIRLNEVFNKITYIWHHNSVTKGSGKPTTMTCDVIESVRSDLNVPISNNERMLGEIGARNHMVVMYCGRDGRKQTSGVCPNEGLVSFTLTLIPVTKPSTDILTLPLEVVNFGILTALYTNKADLVNIPLLK
ncbi:hypothetical protein M8J77_014600 [Diaphorina citri]|nr:hypothetical protein M8J77_014600 [Diaphorina citri]